MKLLFAALAISTLALTAGAETKRLDAPRDLSKEKVIGAVQYDAHPQVAAVLQAAAQRTTTVTTVSVKFVPAQPKPGLKFSDLLPSRYERHVYYDTRPTAPAAMVITTTVKK